MCEKDLERNFGDAWRKLWQYREDLKLVLW